MNNKVIASNQTVHLLLTNCCHGSRCMVVTVAIPVHGHLLPVVWWKLQHSCEPPETISIYFCELTIFGYFCNSLIEWNITSRSKWFNSCELGRWLHVVPIKYSFSNLYSSGLHPLLLNTGHFCIKDFQPTTFTYDFVGVKQVFIRSVFTPRVWHCLIPALLELKSLGVESHL